MLHLLIFLSVFTRCIFAEEWDPVYYIQGTEEQRPQYIHAIKEVPKLLLNGDEKVLDVGCGDGATTAYIAHHWLPQGTIHGIDISQSMINNAHKKYHSSQVTFEKTSLFDYNPATLYDAVVCFWVLFLFDDYGVALEKVIAHLKPGGKALICHIIDPGTPFLQAFKKHIAPQQMPLVLPTLETVVLAVKKAAVAINYLEVKYNYDRYVHIDELIRAMQKIPFFSMLPHDKEAILYQELLKQYVPEEDGSVYDYSLVVCMILEKK